MDYCFRLTDDDGFFILYTKLHEYFNFRYNLQALYVYVCLIELYHNPFAYSIGNKILFLLCIIGQYGKPYAVNESDLTAGEKQEYDDGWKKNSFNQFASDRISVNRVLTDPRDPELV